MGLLHNMHVPSRQTDTETHPHQDQITSKADIDYLLVDADFQAMESCSLCLEDEALVPVSGILQVNSKHQQFHCGVQCTNLDVNNDD